MNDYCLLLVGGVMIWYMAVVLAGALVYRVGLTVWRWMHGV